METAALTSPCCPAQPQHLLCQSVPDTLTGQSWQPGKRVPDSHGVGLCFCFGVLVFFLINLMQMSSSSWLSPSLPCAPAGAGCVQSPRGLLGTGCEHTWSPASLFIFAVRGSVLSAHLGIPAPLPPPPSSFCRALPLRWLRRRPSLVPSWGQTRDKAAAPRPAWRPVLAALLVPAWDTQHFGSCSGGARAPLVASQGPWPGDSGCAIPAGAGLCW